MYHNLTDDSRPVNLFLRVSVYLWKKKKIPLPWKKPHYHPFFFSVLYVCTQLYTWRQIACIHFKTTSMTGAKTPKDGRNYRIHDWCQGNKSEQGAWDFSLLLGRLCELSPLTSRGDNVGGGTQCVSVCVCFVCLAEPTSRYTWWAWLNMR